MHGFPLLGHIINECEHTWYGIPGKERYFDTEFVPKTTCHSVGTVVLIHIDEQLSDFPVMPIGAHVVQKI